MKKFIKLILITLFYIILFIVVFNTCKPEKNSTAKFYMQELQCEYEQENFTLKNDSATVWLDAGTVILKDGEIIHKATHDQEITLTDNGFYQIKKE